MGIPTLISTATASNAATVSITSGIDSTYDEYMFVFTDINPTVDSVEFQFQMDVNGSTDYDTTITSTSFYTYNQEDDGGRGQNYDTGQDQALGTAFQTIGTDIGNGTDESCAGILHIFSPSNTTYVKHFYSRFQEYQAANTSQEVHTAGYLDLTTALDKIQFKMSSGNFDGVIQMYGIA